MNDINWFLFTLFPWIVGGAITMAVSGFVLETRAYLKRQAKREADAKESAQASEELDAL